VCNFVKVEGAFDLLMPPSRRESQYCQSNRAQLGGVSSAIRAVYKCTSREQLKDRVNPQRYFKLNLHSLFKPQLHPGTVEFRQPGASQNPAKVMGFVVLFVKFVELSCLEGRE
jgi:hypothetical protein